MGKADVHLEFFPLGLLMAIVVAVSTIAPIFGLGAVALRKMRGRRAGGENPAPRGGAPPELGPPAPAHHTRTSQAAEQPRRKEAGPPIGAGGHFQIDRDYEFARITYLDAETGVRHAVTGADGRTMVVKTAAVPMTDALVAGLLGDVGDVLAQCFEGDAHFAALYDLRTYKLPAVKDCYARVRERRWPAMGWIFHAAAAAAALHCLSPSCENPSVILLLSPAGQAAGWMVRRAVGASASEPLQDRRDDSLGEVASALRGACVCVRVGLRLHLPFSEDKRGAPVRPPSQALALGAQRFQ